MSTQKVVRIPILPLGLVNAHLIRGPKGCLLVDTGLPGSERKIEKVLRKQGMSFQDIKLIVITHAHVDHAGSAVAVRARSGAPILAHAGDLIASGILLGGIVLTDHAKRPPFEDDPHAVGTALHRLVASGMTRFYMGHGGPLEAPEVSRHARILLETPRES